MDLKNLSAQTKAEAARLGFDACGVCAADAFAPECEAAFRAWLAAGRADKMGYLKRNVQKRFNPRELFPEAEAAIVCAANYFRPGGDRRIALYAQGVDYHTVIKERLRALCAFLEERGGVQKTCVDTSPIAEKLLAARAGLGSIGKNTLLIRKFNGPWSFIGIVLTSLKLPPDAVSPAALPRCGSCKKCLEACPSGALEDGSLNAAKCVSNLSIERKYESLDEGERALLGQKLFGCDECLRACPFGQNAPTAEIPEFTRTISLPENAAREDLENLAEGTPISRAFR